MLKLRCTVCNWVYDEKKEGKKFSELPADWTCPVCNVPKSAFVVLTEEEAKEPAGEKTVSEVLVEQMVEWGIRFVFGIPGTSSLGLIDAIRQNSQVTYIQVRHEQTAAFMAAAYRRPWRRNWLTPAGRWSASPAMAVSPW